MSRKHKQIKGRFVPLTHELIDSPAWGDLSGNDRSMFIDFMRQRNGFNDRNLTLPYSKMRTASATSARSLKKLITVGLLDVIKQGGLFRSYTVYGISNRWRLYKNAPLLGKSIDIFRK